jgi:DNA-binding beta-propeller fold protein YncE
VELRDFPKDWPGPSYYAGAFPRRDMPPLANPQGTDFAEGRLYVAASDQGVIRVFNVRGGNLATLRVPPARGTRGSYPVDVASIGGGRLIVVDTATNRAVVLQDGKTRTFARDRTKAPAQPTAVAVHKGEVFIADGASGVIRVYDLEGRWRRDLGERVSPRLTFMTSMAIDDATLWVADSNSGRVVGLDPASGTLTTRIAKTFRRPRGVAVDDQDRVYVADAFERTLTRFTPSGVLDAELVSAKVDPKGTAVPLSDDEALLRPEDVAWVGGGPDRVYVNDSEAGLVRVYDVR